MAHDLAQARFGALFGQEFGHGKHFYLARLRAALAKLGDPQTTLSAPLFHVAGTNGKGSTIAFLRAIAEADGLCVHAFTKPHLLNLRERFTVASEAVSDDALVAAAEEIVRVDRALTNFDAQVAAAFLLFNSKPADLILLETGMGGRDDSTNVIPSPAATILTPIALDHQDALGATLAEIAAHKAGILKAHTPAIVAHQQSETMVVIEAEAERIGAPLYRQGVEWDAFAQAGRLIVQTESRALDLPLPALAGPHQIDNAGLAVATFLASGRPTISGQAFVSGITNAHWPGRLQPITSGPLAAQARGAEIWIDAGHNPHAAQALARALADMQKKRPAITALILGMRARKNWRAFVETLAPSAALTIAIPLSAESADPEALAQAARDVGAHALTAPNPHNAIATALANGGRRILICGSFLLAAEALRTSEC